MKKRASPNTTGRQPERASKRLAEATSSSSNIPPSNMNNAAASFSQTSFSQAATANVSSSSSSAADIKAKSIGKRSGASSSSSSSTPPLPPTRLKSGDFDKLPLDNVLDMLIFLNIPDIVRFTMTCKLHYQSDTTPDWLWKPLLNTPQVDPLQEYKFNVSESKKELLESKFSYKKIIKTIMSDKCVRCNAPTQGFDILSCSRACDKCWTCIDKATFHQKLDVTSPFALCALSYATSHYLVNEKEIRNANICILEVENGPAKKVVNVKSIKQLGEDKFGGEVGLAKVKKKRAAKSEENWLAKCEVA